MSASAKDGPSVPTEKKGGLSKIVSRMKTVLKRTNGPKGLSLAAKSAPATTTAGPSVIAPTQPLTVTTPEPVEPTTAADGHQAVKMLRSQVDADRAKRLAERFALPPNPVQSRPDKEIQRIEKPVRMRIHRSCHRCNTTFRGGRICSQCEHVRCKACPRYPPKRTESEKTENDKGREKGPAAAAVVAIEPDTYWNLREPVVLTKPSPRAGAQPLVRQIPKQRVRRTCHCCQTLFAGKSKICSGCDHVRCVECPRDPHKKKYYPDGYPGDAFSSNTSIPVKYSCHKCLKVFPAVPHPDSEAGRARQASDVEPLACVRCHHPMCSDCPRAPPVKIQPAPDPDVLRAVQVKLAALSVSHTGPS